MGLAEMLKEAGFTRELSTAGERFILEGVYKAVFVDCAAMEDKGYGTSVYAQFKISEVLSGTQSNSQYPEFKAYFDTSPEKIASKKKGLAKLINGLFSNGTEADADNLADSKGAEVYISAFKDKTWKKEGEEFVEVEGAFKQGFAFMTEKNAVKKAAQKNKGQEALPF